jgi:hypothetical protein
VRQRLTALVIIGAAATAGCAGAAGATSSTGNSAPGTSGRPHTVTLAASARHEDTLAVVTGAATITVTAAAMPGKLLRASTPANSGIRPDLVESAGRVQLFLDSASGGDQSGGPDAVMIQLNSAVTWQLQFSGGASQTILDLGNAKVAGIDFTAGSSLIRMQLSRPAGTATITVAGGASQFAMAVPPGVPTRLELDGGASTATLAGLTRVGIAGGTTLTGPGWALAASRYDVVAPAGISDITVTSEAAASSS